MKKVLYLLFCNTSRAALCPRKAPYCLSLKTCSTGYIESRQRQFELCIDNSNWINELTLVEGINESVKLQYKNNVKPYLKLISNSSIKYSGKFAVQLELSDGTLFSDTTQYIIINTTNQ